VRPSFGVQVRKLARRSIVRTVREPVILIPNLIFPLFMLAMMSGAADRVTAIKGFPTDNYTSFVLGAIVVQAAAGATTIAGTALGSDIETGFLNRLALTPARGFILIAAQLAGVAVLGLIQVTLVLLVGLAGGATVEAGLMGALVLLAFALLVVLTFGSIGMLVAVRTGKPERVQGLLPLTLALLFMSTLAIPRNLIDVDWFKAIATYNPVSYLIEAARSLLITGWDAEALALGCGIAVVGLVAALMASTITLRRRLVGA
jgi:ABC-2 type transport system permease protein